MTIERVVDFLNEALVQDAESISKVFLDIDVFADQYMINDPKITVSMEGRLRMIGLLNGLVGDGHSVLRMNIDNDTNMILSFDVVATKENSNISRVVG